MQVDTATRWKIVLFGGLLMIISVILIILSYYLPLPQLGGILIPQRTIINSTLPLSLKWSFTASSAIQYRPIVADRFVLLRAAASVIALDAQTGIEAWEYTSRSLSLPDQLILVQNDKVVFPSDFNISLNAVRLNDGKLLWRISRGLFDGQISEELLDDQRVYVTDGRTEYVWAYSLDDGKLLWRSQLLDGASSVRLRGKDLYIFGNPVRVLDTETGRSKAYFANKFEGGVPVIDNDLVLQQDYGNLMAREVATGDTRWTFPRNLGGYGRYYRPLDRKVFASTGCCALTAIDEVTGQVIWQKQFSTDLVSSVTAIGPNGYIKLKDGSLQAFELGSDADAGKLITSPRAVSPYYMDKGLETDDSSLYATFGDKTVFAFGK